MIVDRLYSVVVGGESSREAGIRRLNLLYREFHLRSEALEHIEQLRRARKAIGVPVQHRGIACADTDSHALHDDAGTHRPT